MTFNFDIMKLEELGWSAYFEEAFQNYLDLGFIPARITAQHVNLYTAMSEQGELEGKVTGKFRFNTTERSDFPIVGDWVAVKGNGITGKMSIHGLLPRRTALERKVASNLDLITEAQVISSNIDIIFIVLGLDLDFNIRRLERYMFAAHESGARPVIIMNKSDLCADVESKIDAIRKIDADIPIHITSALGKEGLDVIQEYLQPAITISLVGSSGVGKSTIINTLLGHEKQKTGSVREHDSHGRHVTTNRELMVLDNGALVIDNPGIRELGLWGNETTLGSMFEDIEILASQCKFNDCRHRTEPKCAIKEAIERGDLEQERYGDYKKMQRELFILARKKDQRARITSKEIKKAYGDL